MRAYKFEPQPDEGDTNNSETLDHAMLVSTHTCTARRAHQEPRALPRRPTVMASGCSH